MSKHYRVYVDVELVDYKELRSYALSRALAAGMTEAEFSEGEHGEEDDNASYWLGWAFDAGTPERCGFSITESGCEEN